MKSLYIKNFRNINELTISSLSNINLIVGKNNVGKSTLLDALSIYASNGNVQTLNQLLEDRGERLIYRPSDTSAKDKMVRSFSSFFPDRKMNLGEENSIVIGQALPGEQQDVLSLQYVYYIDETVIDQDGLSSVKRKVIENPADLTTDIIDRSVPGHGVLIKNQGINVTSFLRFTNAGMKTFVNSIRFPFQLIKTNAISREANSALWDAVVMTELEKYIILALRIIEPSIEALSFIEDDSTFGYERGRIPVVKLRNSDMRYRLSAMGDGINRILTIILSIVNCKGGLCLIDEFENGLHYTVQYQLWKIIFGISRELNVQIFATSHSSDCISSFSAVIEDDAKNDGQLIRLEKRSAGIISVNYSPEELETITKRAIEIR